MNCQDNLLVKKEPSNVSKDMHVSTLTFIIIKIKQEMFEIRKRKRRRMT